MRITFQDEHGRPGNVSDDLGLEYEGRWKDEIRAYIEQLEQDAPDDGEADAKLQDLLIELPEEAPITRIQRRD